MFETAELGCKVAKKEYEAEIPGLRTRLLELQFELRERDFPVIVLLAGDDRKACNDVLNILHEWLDPRFLHANAWGRPTDEVRERPLFWRYWRALPPRGRIGVFVRAWSVQAFVLRLLGDIDAAGLEVLTGHIRRFESALCHDGALVVKFWFHLPEKKLRKRLEAADKDRKAVLMVKKHDRKLFADYDRAMQTIEHILRRTSTGEAPWRIIESADARYRNLAVGRALADVLRERMEGERAAAPEPVTPGSAAVSIGGRTVLDQVDLSRSLSKDEYSRALTRGQAKLNRLSREAFERGVSSVLVFEGWDAAGKGGIVRRLAAAMDASQYRIIPIAAPNTEERAHHYLWRFWRYLPRSGDMTIYDRSWYGRVLVERVEGFATEDEWRRAYAEINDFEEQLVGHGIVLLKFWLHIDKDEQLRRFRAREQTPFKKFKITSDDYRNRERWDDYEAAVNEMVQRTSTDVAHWNLVAANDKRWARIQVLKTVCRALDEACRRARD
jgi:polyphosphate:AMP phosphotransferase